MIREFKAGGVKPRPTLTALNHSTILSFLTVTVFAGDYGGNLESKGKAGVFIQTFITVEMLYIVDV